MIFFTADTHLGHFQILKHDKAPFPDIDTRDQHILDVHNSIVSPQDTVWHLGDVAFRQDKLEWYLDKANGHIHLVRGNHDDRLAWKFRDRFASAHEAIYLRLNLAETGRFRVYLSHYAMRTWRNSHHGSYHLYGHSHGCLPDFGRSMDVGVKPNNYKPLSLLEIYAKLSVRPHTPHHPGTETFSQSNDSQ